MVRTLLASAGTGCAIAFGYRGEWTPTALAGAGVVAAVAFWAYGELAAARAMLRARPDDHERCGQMTTAATLTDLAARIDADLAGGVPAKAVAQRAADIAREYGREVRAAVRAALP